MTIYLIRHGETDWNKLNKLQGTEDIPLNETGLQQSLECARALEGIPADYILSSPLVRARVTAEIISRETGGPAVTVEEDLTERDFGKLSGKTYADREAMLAAGVDPCMEPFEPLTARLLAVLRRYIARKDCKTIFAVSHGASINAVLSVLSGGEIGTGKTVLKNVCINKLCCHDETIDIEFYNMTPEAFLNYLNGNNPPQ